MRNRGLILRVPALLAALALATLAGAVDRFAQSDAGEGDVASGSHFLLSSPDLPEPEHGMIHRRQVNDRCGGQNVSPALEWRNPPAGTLSFALLMHDPDAPQAQGFWHWVVYDIPPTTTGLPAGAGDPHKKLLPAGAIEGRSDFGKAGYGGPCPPPGSPHRYVFRLYALPVAKLNVPPEASGIIVSSYASASALGSAQLIARYGR
jgi:Raf kinase inhibitor-like YbhB/YbcL family protein